MNTKALVLIISISIAMIEGCAAQPFQAVTATDQTPRSAIEQAEAAQESKHTWIWWAAGALAAGLLAANMHTGHTDTATTNDQGQQTGNVCVTTVCGP